MPPDATPPDVMAQRRRFVALLGAWIAVPGDRALAQAPPAPLGELKSLGQDRYQIGRIVVDKRARTFTVPGRINVVDTPLEYLATSPGGQKAYETLLELDATGSEFNLACILVGLDRDPRHAAARMAGNAPLPGPRVAISVAWIDGGQRRQVSAAQALLSPGSDIKLDSIEWVYIGAPASDGQDRFAADVRGTLIGFKADENNVIESALGIGIGAYGSVRGNSVLPALGAPIELIVDATPQAARR